MRVFLQKIKYSLWLSLGKLFDLPIFAPINLIWAKSYLLILTPSLQWILARKIRGAKLFARHSVKSRQYFNPFFSDLDLTVVLNHTNTPGDQSSPGLLVFSRLRPFLPFLGELEVFTRPEWERRSEIVSKNPSLYELIRSIRKLKWLYNDLQSATTPYHRHKTLRAIELVSKKYGGPAGGSEKENLAFLLNIFSAQIDQYFLGLPAIKTPVTGINCEHLAWSPEELLAAAPCGESLWPLLALTPTTASDPSTENALRVLRQSPQLRTLCIEYTEAEAILLEAVFRARADEFPWMGDYAKRLWVMKAALSSHSPCEMELLPQREPMGNHSP